MNCFRSDLVQPETQKVEGMIERLKSTKGAELVKTCELLAYEVFLPWLNKQNGKFSNAIRHSFKIATFNRTTLPYKYNTVCFCYFFFFFSVLACN